MARVMTPRAKPMARTQPAKTTRTKMVAASAPKAAGKSRSAAAKPVAPLGKEELRARIEKLERANSTLRMKNKELRLAYVEAAEKVDALTVQLEAAERRAGRAASSRATTTKRRRVVAEMTEPSAQDDEAFSWQSDPVIA